MSQNRNPYFIQIISIVIIIVIVIIIPVTGGGGITVWLKNIQRITASKKGGFFLPMPKNKKEKTA